MGVAPGPGGKHGTGPRRQGHDDDDRCGHQPVESPVVFAALAVGDGGGLDQGEDAADQSGADGDADQRRRRARQT